MSKQVQNSEISELPNASKCFQMAKTVHNRESGFVVAITLSHSITTLERAFETSSLLLLLVPAI